MAVEHLRRIAHRKYVDGRLRPRHAHEPFEIRADDATRKALKLDDLSKELNGKFSLSGSLDEGTGVVVSAAGGKLSYDNTLETRLSRLQGTLRSAVYKVLMGE